MENLPAPQLQKMRADLREDVTLIMTKRRLMKIALEKANKSRKGVDGLEKHLLGMPALIFTKENPFRLYRRLKKSKSRAPAKGGQTAPGDITVPAGPTPFAPGPIIGELGAVGIKSGVDAGKVTIKQESVVAKRGDTISAKLAEVLARLGIQPMEVGLDLTAIYEDGIIYTKDILDVDEDAFMQSLQGAAARAFSLACFIAYPTNQTTEYLIAKAFRDAKAIGLSQNIIDEGIIDELLKKAERSALGVKAAGNVEIPEKKNATADAKEKSPKARPEKSTDEKVAEIVEKTKKHAEGEATADDLIQEAGKKG